jgi:hypothetical protein
MTDLTELLRRWSSLPDDAIVPSKLTAAVTSLSERSIRYHPGLKRVYLNRTRYGFRAGDVRKILAGGEAAR